MSRPARALWIEILSQSVMIKSIGSRPARALWIEISFLIIVWLALFVEAREGLVD